MSWLPKRCVVVPVDFSEQSLNAVDLALGLVEDTSNVHVIHVLAPIAYLELEMPFPNVDDEARRRHAEMALRERLSAPQHQKLQVKGAIGDPGREISDYAQEVGAELIVLPSHGRTGISRLLIGSVAERVVRLAHCPVLVLRS
jgi:nucleotide-binding universal stress UspA family protein